MSAKKRKPLSSEQLSARVTQGRLLRMSERKIAKAVPCSKRTVQEYSPARETLELIWVLVDKGVVKVNDLAPPSSPLT